MNPYPRTWIDIDLLALAHNIARVRRKIGSEAKIALVAKADAYGHGLVPIARHALRHGVDWIAVATVQEGVALRDAGVVAPVLVLSPILPIEAEQAVFYGLRIMVEDHRVAKALSEAAVRQQATAIVHLKVDTGLARFGCLPEEAGDLAASIKSLPSVVLEGMASHFADSGRDPARTAIQMDEFAKAIYECSARGIEFEVLHQANSAGTALYPASRRHLVRVGIAAYGIDPYGMFEESELAPVMNWRARVMGVRRRKQGTRVSYLGTHELEGDGTLATLGVGYGDGYPRALSNIGWTILEGIRAPVRGLVCMDQLVVEVTGIDGIEPGCEATLIGEGAPVVEIARAAGTNCHEIITRVMSRVPRRYRSSA